jgi:hypothetical protein
MSCLILRDAVDNVDDRLGDVESASETLIETAKEVQADYKAMEADARAMANER